VRRRVFILLEHSIQQTNLAIQRRYEKGAKTPRTLHTTVEAYYCSKPISGRHFGARQRKRREGTTRGTTHLHRVPSYLLPIVFTIHYPSSFPASPCPCPSLCAVCVCVCVWVYHLLECLFASSLLTSLVCLVGWCCCFVSRVVRTPFGFLLWSNTGMHEVLV
jgi:hypothetical protein